MNKGVYFAHSMSDYNTKWERDALAYIEKIFRGMDILNPSLKRHQTKWKLEGMHYYDKYFMPKINTFVFAPFPDGTIGSGVSYELLHAYASHIPIYEVSRDFTGLEQITSIASVEERFLKRIETRGKIQRYSNATD
jgi:hypothetical protein